MDRARIDFDLLGTLPVKELDDGYYASAEALTNVQGDLHLELGDFKESFEEVPMLMISSSLITSLWNALTFRSNKAPYCISLIDHEPVMQLKLTPNERLSVSLMMAGTTFAQCLCDPLDFLRQAGELHERVLHELFKASRHLSMNRAFLKDFPSVPDFVGIYSQ